MNHHDIFHEEKLARGKARYGNSFDESKIKRDEDGKFSTTGGNGGSKESATKERKLVKAKFLRFEKRKGVEVAIGETEDGKESELVIDSSATREMAKKGWLQKG